MFLSLFICLFFYLKFLPDSFHVVRQALFALQRHFLKQITECETQSPRGQSVPQSKHATNTVTHKTLCHRANARYSHPQDTLCHRANAQQTQSPTEHCVTEQTRNRHSHQQDTLCHRANTSIDTVTHRTLCVTVQTRQ